MRRVSEPYRITPFSNRFLLFYNTTKVSEPYRITPFSNTLLICGAVYAVSEPYRITPFSNPKSGVLKIQTPPQRRRSEGYNNYSPIMITFRAMKINKLSTNHSLEYRSFHNRKPFPAVCFRATKNAFSCKWLTDIGFSVLQRSESFSN